MIPSQDFGALAESPEAMKEMLIAEENDALLDARYEDPDTFKNELAEANKSLYGSAFVAPKGELEVGITHSTVESQEKQSPAELTRESIIARSGMKNSEEAEDKLDDPEQREKNKERAEGLFFTDEKLSKDIAQYSGDTPSGGKEWFETNTGAGGPLDESFSRVMENFILPEHIQGENLSDIYRNNPQDAITVNDALSDAFVLEIQEHTLKGRVNYPEDKVQALMEDIQDIQTTPYEMLRIFGQIHTIVEGSAGRGGRQQELAYQKVQKNNRANLEKARAFNASKLNKDIKKESENTQEENTPHTQEQDISSGEVFGGSGELEVGGSEQTSPTSLS